MGSGPIRPRSVSDLLVALSYGYYEDTRLMVRFPVWSELPFVGGWLTARAAKNQWIRGGQLDFVYVPAASRLIDAYGAVGIDLPTRERRRRVVQELGIVIHVPLLMDELGKPGALIRISMGMRGPMLSKARSAKFVFDVGFGGW